MKRALLLLLLASLSAVAQEKISVHMPADAIFINGNVDAGVVVDVESGLYHSVVYQRAQALAIRRDRIIAVGTDKEIRMMKGDKTEVVDLQGRVVMPGFNDAHVHLASAGMTKLRVNLEGSKSLEEMTARVAQGARSEERRVGKECRL